MDAQQYERRGVCPSTLRRYGGAPDRFLSFFFQAEDGIRDYKVTGVQTCALPIYQGHAGRAFRAVQADELVLLRRGKAPRQRMLARSQHVDGEMAGALEIADAGRLARQAPQHQDRKSVV